MNYLGDFAEDAYVPIGLFTTNAADGGRESFSTTLEEADFIVYRDDGAGSWGTLTLTAGSVAVVNNPGTNVGAYLVTVDMSNDDDFITGRDYCILLYPDEQVDSQDVAAALGHWSCENRPVMSVDAGAKTGYALTVTPPTAVAIRTEIDTNGIIADWANGGRLDLIIDQILADTNELQTNQSSWTTSTLAATDIVSDGTALNTTGGALDLVTDITTKAGFSLSTAGILAIWHQTVAEIVTVSTIGLQLKTNVDAVLSDIETDTNDLQTNQSSWTTVTGHATEAKQDIIDGIVDNILTDTGTTLPATLADILTDTGTTLPATLADILTDTGTTLPATLAGLSTLSATDIVSDGTALNTTAGALDLVTDITTKTGFALSAAGVDAILDEAIAEPSAMLSWPSSLRDIVGWVGSLIRNEATATATTIIAKNDAGATIGTWAHDDTAGTYTRNEGT